MGASRGLIQGLTAAAKGVTGFGQGYNAQMAANEAAAEREAAAKAMAKYRQDTLDVQRANTLPPDAANRLLRLMIGSKEPGAQLFDERTPVSAISMLSKHLERQEGAKRDAAAAEKKETSKLTPGQIAADKAFGKEYADWNAGGGYADTLKGISQLKKAASTLADPKNASMTGPIVGMQPDWMRAMTQPGATDVKEGIEEVVQRNLRKVLGAQFTEREGERLIARAFNKRLTPAQNAERVNRLITQIEIGAKAKQDAAEYFEKNGTLTGWKGKIPTIVDFNAAIDAAGKEASATASQGGGVSSGKGYTILSVE